MTSERHVSLRIRRKAGLHQKTGMQIENGLPELTGTGSVSHLLMHTLNLQMCVCVCEYCSKHCTNSIRNAQTAQTNLNKLNSIEKYGIRSAVATFNKTQLTFYSTLITVIN